MSITMIGLDTAKSVFQVHAVDAAGNAVIRRKIQRKDLITFFEKQEKCTVVMEACGAAHHWGRTLIGLGHDVKLIPPEAVKPYVKKGKKNDAADAAAICAAAVRPDVKFVPIKTVEQQAILGLHAASVVDISAFKSARHSAAWLGLVPRQHSTAGKTRLGRITKAGNSEIRRMLVLGATSMIRHAGQWNSAAGAWFRSILERCPARLATVALANKNARIAWALMTRNEIYRPSGNGAAAAKAAA